MCVCACVCVCVCVCVCMSMYVSVCHRFTGVEEAEPRGKQITDTPRGEEVCVMQSVIDR